MISAEVAIRPHEAAKGLKRQKSQKKAAGKENWLSV